MTWRPTNPSPRPRSSRPTSVAWRTGAHRAMSTEGLPAPARRMNRRSEWSVRSVSPGPDCEPSGWVRCITVRNPRSWTSKPIRTAGPRASYAKKNARPSQLTGADVSRLENLVLSEVWSSFTRRNPAPRSEPVKVNRPGNPVGGGVPVLYRLSYAQKGRRDSNPQPQDPKEPLPAPQADDDGVKERDNRRDIGVGCEARVRTRTSWFRARRGSTSTTSHWSGREDSNLQPPAPRAGALPLRHVQSY